MHRLRQSCCVACLMLACCAPAGAKSSCHRRPRPLRPPLILEPQHYARRRQHVWHGQLEPHTLASRPGGPSVPDDDADGLSSAQVLVSDEAELYDCCPRMGMRCIIAPLETRSMQVIEATVDNAEGGFQKRSVLYPPDGRRRHGEDHTYVGRRI